MAQLRQDYHKFTDRQAEIIAIGPEDAKTFTDFWRSHKMPFPGIPDPKHKIANLYGQKVSFIKLGRMPSLVVIDNKGKIRYSHYGDSMSDIPSDDEVISMLDELNKE